MMVRVMAATLVPPIFMAPSFNMPLSTATCRCHSFYARFKSRSGRKTVCFPRKKCNKTLCHTRRLNQCKCLQSGSWPGGEWMTNTLKLENLWRDSESPEYRQMYRERSRKASTASDANHKSPQCSCRTKGKSILLAARHAGRWNMKKHS